MNTQQAYNAWASQYDTNLNKTRDLEARSLRETLSPIAFSRCLEIGCGTGKNTEWLQQQAEHVTGVDLSEAMLDIARKKIVSERVEFIQADILQPWDFATDGYDLVTFSLVLEHIEHLPPIFEKVDYMLHPGGYLYIGELHPFKQYTGSKARFDTEAGTQVVTCFNHHFTDFLHPAKQYGLEPVFINEYFDEDDRTGIPRILTLLLQKQ